MNKVNINTHHKAGRRTQHMMESFADLAEIANHKLIDKTIHTKDKKAHLIQIRDIVNYALAKSDELTLGPHLDHIINRFEKANEELDKYIEELDQHGR